MTTLKVIRDARSQKTNVNLPSNFWYAKFIYFNLSPKLLIFGGDQKCFLGPKMQNSLNKFRTSCSQTGGGGDGVGRSGIFPHNPVFSESIPYCDGNGVEGDGGDDNQPAGGDK